VDIIPNPPTEDEAATIGGRGSARKLALTTDILSAGNVNEERDSDMHTLPAM
jgi:hypothetical protein